MFLPLFGLSFLVVVVQSNPALYSPACSHLLLGNSGEEFLLRNDADVPDGPLWQTANLGIAAKSCGSNSLGGNCIEHTIEGKEVTFFNQGFQFGSYFWDPLSTEIAAFASAKDILVKVSAPPVSGAAPGLTMTVIALGTDGAWYEVAAQSLTRDSNFHWKTFKVDGARWRKFSRTCTNQGVRGICMATASCAAGGGTSSPASSTNNVAGCNKLPADVQCCTGRSGVGYSLTLPSVTMFALLVTTDDRSFTSQAVTVSQWHLCSGTISSDTGGGGGGGGGSTGCTDCTADGMVCQNGECVCSNSGAYEISADGGCVALDSDYVCKHCPPRESYRYATRHTSSDTFHGECYLDFDDGNSFKCACDAGYAYDESLKKCLVAPCNPTCAETKARCVNGKCACALNYNADTVNEDGSNCVQDTSGCETACTPPRGCDAATGTCKCPTGTFPSGNSCVKTCTGCNAAEFEECTGTATSSSCTCRSPYTRESGTNGACVLTCSENCATLGKRCVDGTCRCPDNQRENDAGTCVTEVVAAVPTPEAEARDSSARSTTCVPSCNHVKQRCNTQADPVVCECLPDWEASGNDCVNECAECVGVQRDCNAETRECTCPRLWEFDAASGDCIQTSASVTGGEDLVGGMQDSEELTTDELIAIIGGSVGGCCCLVSVLCICLYICSRFCSSEELPPPIPMDGKAGGLYSGGAGAQSSYGGGGSYPNQQGYGGYNTQSSYNTASSYGGGAASPLGAY